MDGLHEQTGSGSPVTIGGKTYTLMPLRADDWGEAARVLASKRKSAIESVKEHLDGLAEPLQKHLLGLAFQEERQGELIAMYEVERWFETPPGAVYRFWLLIRRAHPHITLEAAEALREQATAEEKRELESRKDADNGLPLGNSCGPTPTNLGSASLSLGGASSKS